MLVFRFSDFQADTYAEHERIRSQQGSVWWAWWKKQHEDFPIESFLRFRRSLLDSTGSVGLVNRSGIYLAAVCDRFEFRGGQRIGSPEPNLTPQYYRQDSFPLWMRIIAFEKLDEREWIDRFGAVPIGDDTFFENTSGSVETEVTRSEGIGRGLLHISDLHFGSDFAFKPSGEFYFKEPLEERIQAALPCQPAGVIVSGDLTTKGDNDGLVEARKFLERLSDRLGLERDRIVIAPGNHDILVNSPDVTRSFENEELFRTQIFEFYNERRSLERIHQFSGADGITYIVVALNSSRPRDPSTMEFGYVGSDRSGPVLKEAASLRDTITGPTWLSLVLHHHILPGQQIEYAVPGRPASLAIDAGEIVAMASDLGFDAILHGHEHLPFVGKTSRIAEFGGYVRRQIGADLPVLVLAAGSTSVKVERLTDEMRFNSFNYYEVTPNTVRVQLYQFTSKVAPHVPSQWDFTLQRHT